MKNTILHFDVDKEITPYLKNGIIYKFPLVSINLNKIKNKQSVQIITFKSQSNINAKVLRVFPNLKLLIARTVGTDNVNLDECRKKHINLNNIPDYGDFNVAEHALALILAGARFIPSANQETHQGKFSYQNFLGKSIHGKTIGVIGTGKIGIALIKLLHSFEVQILAYDILKNINAQEKYKFKYVNLSQLLKKSNIISLHIPLLPQTRYLIGENELKLMKKGAILVNTSRGGVINTQALISHISKFHAVCLDVLEDEKEFNISHPLLRLDNVIITPHIGFYTDDAVKKIAQETMQLIKKFKNNL